MKVSVLSMSHARYYTPQGKAAIIRVYDGGCELCSLDYPYDYVLTMNFYDIEPRVGLPSNWNWFNMSDGNVLLDYFNTIKDCDELVVHCYAGVSRSPAIALAYGWFTGDDELVENIKNGKYIPNMQVLNIMSRLIFEDRKVARSKFREIDDFYKLKARTGEG